MARAPLLGVALGLALATSSGLARAEPSIWDAAKDPRAARASFLLRAVERKLVQAHDANFDPGAPSRITRGALAMMELARGRDLPDPRLHFLLGALLTDSAVRRFRDARAELQRALAEAPDSPLAGDAWFNLGITYASLDQPRKEIEAYGHALDRLWQTDQRATVYMNRGEAWMRLFQLEPAIADFRKATTLAATPETIALADYDLGVALERSGDLPSALDAVAHAVASRSPYSRSRSVLDESSVFFVPAYEKYYYRALEAMTIARGLGSGDAEMFYDIAIASWERWSVFAEADKPPWFAHAKLLADTCRQKIRDLQKAPRPRRAKH